MGGCLSNILCDTGNVAAEKSGDINFEGVNEGVNKGELERDAQSIDLLVAMRIPLW